MIFECESAQLDSTVNAGVFKVRPNISLSAKVSSRNNIQGYILVCHVEALVVLADIKVVMSLLVHLTIPVLFCAEGVDIVRLLKN